MTLEERERFSRRVRRGLSEARNEGARYGREGLGWRYAAPEEACDPRGRRIAVIAPDELETVTLIHEMAAEGMSLRDIAHALTELERPTKRGGRWHASTVRAVLRRCG